MLETVREFGLERLAASGEMAEIGRRHAAFYRGVVERGAHRAFLLMLADGRADHEEAMGPGTWTGWRPIAGSNGSTQPARGARSARERAGARSIWS